MIDDDTPRREPDEPARPDPLPDYQRAPLEALGIQLGPDDGTPGPPGPIRTPHAILLRECEHLSLTVRALVRVLERRDLLTAGEVAAERDGLVAEDATDAAVGLIRRLLDEGFIEPLSSTLARAERAHRCCGGTREETSR